MGPEFKKYLIHASGSSGKFGMNDTRGKGNYFTNPFATRRFFLLGILLKPRLVKSRGFDGRIHTTHEVKQPAKQGEQIRVSWYMLMDLHNTLSPVRISLSHIQASQQPHPGKTSKVDSASHTQAMHHNEVTLLTVLHCTCRNPARASSQPYSRAAHLLGA